MDVNEMTTRFDEAIAELTKLARPNYEHEALLLTAGLMLLREFAVDVKRLADAAEHASRQLEQLARNDNERIAFEGIGR